AVVAVFPNNRFAGILVYRAREDCLCALSPTANADFEQHCLVAPLGARVRKFQSRLIDRIGEASVIEPVRTTLCPAAEYCARFWHEEWRDNERFRAIQIQVE